MRALTAGLDAWAAPKDDKTVAWTLGIGWACCGGGLAGGCLVFAKATVKLLSGSLSRQNPGNQFGHAAPIFTLLLLAATAVLQIVCLNRGLRVYDSTLVVPVFYGVYTATGFLDSLIFNNEVDAYQPWTLFLIFASILVLIAGVVLLTHKKPEPAPVPAAAAAARARAAKQRPAALPRGVAADPDADLEAGERDVLWAAGDGARADTGDYNDDEDDDDVDHHQHPLQRAHAPVGVHGSGGARGEEGARLIGEDPFRDGAGVRGEEGARARAARDPFRDGAGGLEMDEFGEWEGARVRAR